MAEGNNNELSASDILEETSELTNLAENTEVINEEVIPEVIEAETKTEPLIEKTDKKAESKLSREDKKSMKAYEKEQKKIEKREKKRAKLQAAIDACPKEYKPVSTNKYFWLTVLCYIPLIGIIPTLIVSLIPRNKNIKNFGRSILVFYLISIILSLITAIVVFFILPNESKEILFDAIGKIIGAFSF